MHSGHPERTSTGEIAELPLVPVAVDLNCCMWLDRFSVMGERGHMYSTCAIGRVREGGEKGR